MTRSVAEELACTDARLLEAYLDGELDAAGLIEVEAHLNGAGSDGTPGCEACRERLLLQRAMRQSLKRVVRTASVEAYGPAPASRDALRARALTAMIAERDRQTTSSVRPLPLNDGRFHWRTLVPIASAAALALFWGAASRGPLSAYRQDARWPDAPDAPGAAGVRAGMGEDLLADLLHEHSNPMPPQWTDPSDVRALDQYIGVPVRPARFERNGASLVGGARAPPAPAARGDAPVRHRARRVAAEVLRLRVQPGPDPRSRAARSRRARWGRRRCASARRTATPWR